MSAAELEAMMVSASYRRLFVSVTSTRLFDAAADTGMVTAYGRPRECTPPTTAASARATDWSGPFAPTSSRDRR